MYEGAQGLYMRQLGFMHRILQCFTWDRCHAWSTRVSCTRPGVLLWALSSLLYTFPACSLPPSFARACLDNSAFSHFSDLLWETFPKFTYSELHSSPSTPLLNCLKALESLHILLVLVSFSHFFFLGNTWELIFFSNRKDEDVAEMVGNHQNLSAVVYILSENFVHWVAWVNASCQGCWTPEELPLILGLALSLIKAQKPWLV